MTEQKAPVEQSGEPVATPEQQENTKSLVNYETHKRLLDEKKKVQQQLDQLLSEKSKREEEEARKRGDFEALLKAREEELAKERSQREQLSERLVNGLKMSSVIEALGGQIDQKWYRLIDTSEVVVTPDGEVDQMTVARVAESLKKQWPEMVKVTSRLPNAAPQGLPNGSGKISRDEWLKLPPKEMKKWKSDQIVG